MAITSPAGRVFTNGTLRVEASVANGAAESIELLANGVRVAVFDDRGTCKLDTSALEEGAYALAATAVVSGQVITSEPLTVVVDRTAPTVVARSPQDGDDNVSAAVPFQVTFSEPVHPSSVDDSAVTVAGGGSVALSKSMVLSQDGLTLTIMLSAAPTLPASVTIDMPGVTDLAGNALSPAARAFSFTIPDWWHPWTLPINDALSDPTLPAVASDTNGVPVVAYVDQAGGSRALRVRRWDGAAWHDLGSPLNVIGDAYVSSIAIRLDNSPIVAWVEFVSATMRQYVLIARWSGNDWRSMNGNRLDSSQAINLNSAANEPGGVHANPGAMRVALALDGNGNPTVAWPEIVGSGASSTFSYFLAQWNGTSWNRLGSASTPGLLCSIGAVVLEGGRPIVAMEEYSGAARTTNVFVRRWADAWVAPYGVGPVDSGTGDSGLNPAIGLDSTGTPIVAYMSLTPPSVIVKRWNGFMGTWQALAQDPYAAFPTLAANSRGDLYLAYSLPQQVVISRWNAATNSWEGSGGLASSQGNAGPALTVTPSGAPLVSWADHPGAYPGSLLLKTPNR